METRNITQIKVYKLILNPMTGRAEDENIAAMSTSKEGLENLLKEEKVEYYSDEGWNKNFRQGGLLEWYNYARGAWEKGELIEEEWVEEDVYEEIKQLRNFISL